MRKKILMRIRDMKKRIKPIINRNIKLDLHLRFKCKYIPIQMKHSSPTKTKDTMWVASFDIGKKTSLFM